MSVDWLAKIALILLCIPFAGYAVWQGVNLSREQVASSNAPSPAETPAHDQLVERQKSAAAFAGDVRLAAEPSIHFRPLPKGVVPNDPDARKAAQKADERIKELVDLRTFLTPGSKLEFGGSHTREYVQYIKDIKRAEECATKINSWFVDNRLPVGKQAAVEQAKSFDDLLQEYQRVGQIADSRKAAEWEIRARLRIVDNCNGWAESRFVAILERSLPLVPNDELSEMIRLLQTLISSIKERARQLKNDKLVNDALAAEANGTEAITTQWAGRVETLKLLADHPAHLSADRVRDLLISVHSLHAKTREAPIQKLLRQKAQQICAAAVPKKLRLDGNVMLDKKSVARSQVGLRDIKGEKLESLTDDSEGVNEFNAPARQPTLNYFAAGGRQYAIKDLEPTATSQAGHEFNQARSLVALWSNESANKLKERFATKGEVLDAMHEFDAPAKGVEKRQGAWTRLVRLSEVIAECGDLFPTDGK